MTQPPLRPYLMAFSTRLNSTCCKRSASAQTRRFGRNFVFQGGFAGGGGRAKIIQHALGQVVQIDRLQIHGGMAGFQTGNGQQILDQEQEAVGMLVDFLQKPHGLSGIVLGPVKQGLRRNLDK